MKVQRLILIGVIFSALAPLAVVGQDSPRKPGGPPPLDRMFRFFDKNRDGHLSREEYQSLTAASPRLKDAPDIARQLFDRFDVNRDQRLSLQELQQLVSVSVRENPPPVPRSPRPMDPPPPDRGTDRAPSAEGLAFFEKRIRPLLVAECYSCHSEQADKVKGGLTLDTREGIRKGGDSGPAVIPGDVGRSPLILAVRWKDESLRMPPKHKLSDQAIADLETWVRLGAPDPRDGKAATAYKPIDLEEGRRFWSFQAPKRHQPPTPKDAAWARTDVDRFLLVGMEAKGLKPVADAEPHVLLRRLHLDLTGLPPTPEDVAAFVFDPSPQAVAEIVDRLLASRHFGERWGRHWLDVARYAETSGKSVNFNFPHAWRYRDYVIASFNADKPYDQFIREQIAGDLLPAKDDAAKAEQQIATGFLAIGPKALNERNRLQFALDVVDEQIDVTSQAFLGITAACARCHDHKFDPIPMKDYYALAGIFRSTETCYGTIRFVQAQRPSELIELPRGSAPAVTTDKLSREERQRIEQAIADLQKSAREQKDPLRNLFTFAQIELNRSKLRSYDADGNPKLLAMGVREGFPVINSPIYTRGEPDQPGEVVPRGFLQVVGGKKAQITRGSGRRELAEWLADRDNPLTARVMVNRVWLHLFGHGLVRTPDNFGHAGQTPTHPELLDYLALTFMDDGWSIKKLIRRLVLTRAYQLATTHHAANFEIDPDNECYWRMTPRRWDAEALRDSMLAVAGRLNPEPPVGSPIAKAGDGPSSRPRFGVTFRMDPMDPHRSVYLPVMRDNLAEALAVFDGADPSLVVAERHATTVPAQALYLLNSSFVRRTAEQTAQRLLDRSLSESARVREAYFTILNRPADTKELAAAEEFLKAYAKQLERDRTGFAPRRERLCWTAFCQALMASAEFLYRH